MNVPTTKAEIDALQPGAETDRLICQVAGIEPRITWEVLTEDEKASAFSSDNEREAREVFADAQARHTSLQKYHIGNWKHFPRVSTDNAAAITHLLSRCIQPEENFLCISLTGPEADGGWGATLGYNPLGFGLGATADSLAMAVCKAFLLFKLPINGEQHEPA